MVKTTSKIVAALLIGIMVFSAVAIYFERSVDSNMQVPYTVSEEPAGFNLDGKLMEHSFGSISDALNMSPDGVLEANYADVERAKSDRNMSLWVSALRPGPAQFDALYNSSTLKMYTAVLPQSFVYLSQISPEKTAFDYVKTEYRGYPVLSRLDLDVPGIVSVMGTPVVFAPKKMAEKVIDVSEGRAASALGRYSLLLSDVGNDEFQSVGSNKSFASQFYLGLHAVNGRYERTTVYINAPASTRGNITSKGGMFEKYDIHSDGNRIRVVAVSSNFSLMIDPANII